MMLSATALAARPHPDLLGPPPLAAPDARTVEVVVQEIRTEQTKLARDKGLAVLSYIKIGRLLIELQDKAHRNYMQRVEELGYNYRVASRPRRLARSWWGRTGLNESILEKLPSDLMKLEWLCRLSQQQLEQLLERMDCRKAIRGEVIAAVRALLGIKGRSSKGPSLRRAVRSLRQAVALVVAAGQLAYVSQAVRIALAEELKKLQELLHMPLEQRKGQSSSSGPRGPRS